MRRSLTIAWLTFQRFLRHDAWAVASHISLSMLMALFPFLIVLTALASLVGQKMLAVEAVDLMLDGWPSGISGPILREIHAIMTGARTGVVTFGAVFALYFSSSGIEALRIGLNRAYDIRERRSWWLLRLESIFFVVTGAALLLAVAFLLVLGPQAWQHLVAFWPVLADLLPQWDAGPRLTAALAIVLGALLFAHKIIPSGDRSVLSILPGIGVTLALWTAATLGFSWYLQLFPGAYTSTYGGLATIMVVLIYINMLAAIFLFGGEVNGLLRRRAAFHASRNALTRSA